MFASQPVVLHRLRLWPVHRVKAWSFSFSRLPFSQGSCPSHSNWLSSEMQFWCPHVLRGCQSSSLLAYFPHPCLPVTLQTHLDPAVDGGGKWLAESWAYFSESSSLGYWSFKSQLAQWLFNPSDIFKINLCFLSCT